MSHTVHTSQNPPQTNPHPNSINTTQQSQFRLDAVLCICDAEALHAALALQETTTQPSTSAATAVATATGFEVASLGLIGEQLALSDRVLINKVDLLKDPGVFSFFVV
jgi:G3E family GTPase